METCPQIRVDTRESIKEKCPYLHSPITRGILRNEKYMGNALL